MSRPGEDQPWVPTGEEFPPKQSKGYYARAKEWVTGLSTGENITGGVIFLISLILIILAIKYRKRISKFANDTYKAIKRGKEDAEERVRREEEELKRTATMNIPATDPSGQSGGNGTQLQTYVKNLQESLPEGDPLKNVKPVTTKEGLQDLIDTLPLPTDIKQLSVPDNELQIPQFLMQLRQAVQQEAPELASVVTQALSQAGGQVDNLMASTQTARKTSPGSLEDASKVVCAEDEKFKAHLLKMGSTWSCKDATCKEWSVNGKDVDQGIVDAQCGVLGLASGCESTLRNCATGDINDCFSTLVTVGNKFGGYGCGEKTDAIKKVSPGLVRDILTHLGFKTQFKRDVSHGIDLLAFESLPEYLAHSTDALRVRLESPLYNNLTSFLRLMIEWANAHPEMLNDALVKSNVKVTHATPLDRFTLKEKSIIPGTETGDLRGIINELTRLGYQQGGMSAQGLSHYFQNISAFTQKLNAETIHDIRMGRTSVQSGGNLSAESVLGTLKYRSTADSAIFSAIIDEIRKMLNSRYNIDLSTKSQQRVQEKLEAFRAAERALFDSMSEALERERVLRATGQQIDIDNVTNDAERQRLIQHYTGMSKLLDDKNKHATKLISAIQSMLKAGVDYDNRRLGMGPVVIM